MGSAPIAAAAAQTRNPVRQALVSSTGTFWDTVVVCLMTGLVLVTTIMKNPNINADEVSDGGVLTSLAFGQIPVLGPLILTLGIICFAYSTILGWAYYGERCVEYFAGRFGKGVLIGYRLLYVAVAAIAPVVALDLIWLIADTLNAVSYTHIDVYKRQQIELLYLLGEEASTKRAGRPISQIQSVR